MGFEPIEQEQKGFTPLTPKEPAPRTVFGDVGNVPIAGTPSVTFQDVLGLAEQPAAGAYGLVSQAWAGGKALGLAALAKTAGLPFAETFNEEFKQGVNDLPEYVPLTPAGAQFSQKMSDLMALALEKVGEVGFQTGPLAVTNPLAASLMRQRDVSLDSPTGGAATQALATLGLMALTPAGKSKTQPGGKAPQVDPTVTVDRVKAFETLYPKTAQAIDASQVGKMNLAPTDPKAPMQTSTKRVIDAVTESLNKELGVDTTTPLNPFLPGKGEFDVLANVKNASLSDKLRMVIMKYGPDMPAADQVAWANAYLERLATLQKIQDDIVGQRPRLPNPAREKEPAAIEVDSTGKAYTPNDIRVRDAAYKFEYDKFLAWQAEREATLSGKPVGIKGSSQRGAFDIEGLEQNVVDAINGMKVGSVTGGFASVALDKKQQSFFKTMDADTWESIYGKVPGIEFEGNNVRIPATSAPMLKEVLDGVDSGDLGKIVKIDVLREQERMKQFHKELMDRVSAGAAEMKQRADEFKSSGQALFYPGDRILSNKTKRVYEITGYSWNAKHGYLYNFRSVDGDTVSSLIHDRIKDGDFTKMTGPRRSERGAFDIEGLEQNVPAAVQATKQATTKGWTAPTNLKPEEMAIAAERALDNNYKAMEEKKRIFSLNSVKAVRRAVVSHDYDLQKALGDSGELGQTAMLRMNVEHNANMVAKSRYDSATRAIFDDLSKDDLKLVEKIVRLRRIMQIDSYKGVGTVRHEVDPVTKVQLTGPVAQSLYTSLKDNLGPRFDALDRKATAIFTEEKVNLKRLLDEGIIDQRAYDKMKNLDYSRTEYMDLIDPEIPVRSHIKDFPKSIRGSGIPELGRGKNAAVNMDAKGLMIEDIARSENVIARNKTLKALYDLATSQPDNGVVMIPKSVRYAKKDGKALKQGDEEVTAVPEGWTSLGVRVEGKQRNVLIRDDFAQQFVARPDLLNKTVLQLGDMDVTMASILRTVSGSALLRASATTYNPAFILAGLPMDILHLWAATNKTYSPHLPVYALQIGRDLAVTAKDALLRKGRWEQAMLEGMGPNFLTHESRVSAGAHSTIQPRLQKLRTAMAFLGDFQDMWVRLAHRERLIRDGMSSEMATATAVERLNYYRGGTVTKFVDTMVPYTNIAVNALSKVVENSAKDKTAALTKLAWFTGASSAAIMANMISSPETWKQVPTEDKVRNTVITFGDQYFIIDPDGNKRYMYATIRLDQTFMPFQGALVAGLENAEYGKVPDSIATKAMGQINPLSTMFPPTWQAYRSYADNYDPLRDSPIYQGLKVNPEAEIRNISKNNPTGPLAVAVGEMLGMSPMGLEKAASSLLNTNNFYIQAAGGALRLIFDGYDERQQAQDVEQLILQEVPGLRSVVKLTTPGIEQMRELDKIQRDVNSLYRKQIDGLQEVLFKMQHGKAQKRDLEEYIKQQPVEAQQALLNHAKYSWTVDTIMKKMKASDGIPPRSWWVTSAQIKDEARAQVFYNEWVSASAEDRRRMISVANGLQAAGTGYLSQGFQREFAKQRQLLGDEQR